MVAELRMGSAPSHLDSAPPPPPPPAVSTLEVAAKKREQSKLGAQVEVAAVCTQSAKLAEALRGGLALAQRHGRTQTI
jgi:hypothetical protein